MKPSAVDIMALLRRIEAGEVTVTPVCGVDPQEVYCGNVVYRTSTDWLVTVFNDCDEWDYLDSVIDIDGDLATFDDMDRDGEDTRRAYCEAHGLPPIAGRWCVDDNAIDHPFCYVPTYPTREIWGFGDAAPVCSCCETTPHKDWCPRGGYAPMY